MAMFLDNFGNNWLFYPELRYPKMVLYSIFPS